MRECADFLRRLIELTDPTLVVALGRVALESLAFVTPHDVAFGDHVGQPRSWDGRHLVSLYHPSGQTLGRRARADQLRDYRVIAAWQRGTATTCG
jgi:uracil-DNA glycosylase